LGYSAGQQDAWSKQIERWGGSVNDNPDHTIPPGVVDLADQVAEFPRHLGIHPGGMVICDRPVVEVIPVEWARMADRTVIQLDKDGAAAIGLVKFDLLGLGMLSAMQTMLELIPAHYGHALDLARLPQDDPRVFDMLCAADTVGVFQVESRAQMSTLPRLRPRKFYDLVVEVGLIRPGPIQGGSVHPYLRRHAGTEKVTYPHDLLKPALEKTLGVPLFQEQMMEMAIDAASFSPDEADELRRAMGSKRSAVKMAKLRERLFAGMAENGITGPVADDIYDKLQAFSNFGFAESHAISFAYIVYSSSYAKMYYPAAFYAGLLSAQPMGFYSPQSLIADARRHGITVLPPDINDSAADATLKPGHTPAVPVEGVPRLGRDEQPEPIIRLGLSSVRRLGDDAAERVAAGRPYADLGDLARRTQLTTPQMEALAAAGAFDSFGLDRRQALWAAGPAASERDDKLAGAGTSTPPALPAMSIADQTVADLWSTGVTTDRYPTELMRPWLTEQGVITAAQLRRTADGTRVWVGGIVTHRQRPATASGITFMSLEDETGLINIVCSPGAWARNRRIARESSALIIRGRCERAGDVVNIVAEQFRKLPLTTGNKSRDFR
jgi:error-prone DNA polymerase